MLADLLQLHQKKRNVDEELAQILLCIHMYLYFEYIFCVDVEVLDFGIVVVVEATLNSMCHFSSAVMNMHVEDHKLDVVDTVDPHNASFILHGEDHTLGNALRWSLMQNPAVKFAGYCNPHPLEDRIIIKIMTNSSCTAVEALRKGFQDLKDVAKFMLETFDKSVESSELKNANKDQSSAKGRS